MQWMPAKTVLFNHMTPQQERYVAKEEAIFQRTFPNRPPFVSLFNQCVHTALPNQSPQIQHHVVEADLFLNEHSARPHDLRASSSTTCGAEATPHRTRHRHLTNSTTQHLPPPPRKNTYMKARSMIVRRTPRTKYSHNPRICLDPRALMTTNKYHVLTQRL